MLSAQIGAAGFGTFAGVLFATLAGGLLVSFGINRSSLREVVRLRHDSQEVAARELTFVSLSALVFTAPLGAAVAVVLSWLVRSSSGLRAGVLIAIALGAVAVGVVLVSSELLRAWDRFVAADALGGRNGFASSALFVLLLAIVRPSSVEAALVVQSISLIVPAIVAVFLLRPMLCVVRAKGRAASVLSSGSPFVGSQLLLLVNGMADVWVAGLILTATDAGRYALAARVAGLVSGIQQAAQASFVTDIARAIYSDKRESLEAELRALASKLTILVMILAVLIVAIWNDVIVALLGAEFGDSRVLVTLLLLGQVVNVATGMCGNVLAMSGFERKNLMASAWAGVLTLGAGAAFGSAFGPVGLAAVSAFATASMFSWLDIQTRRTNGIWVHASILPPIRMSGGVGGRAPG